MWATSNHLNLIKPRTSVSLRAARATRPEQHVCVEEVDDIWVTQSVPTEGVGVLVIVTMEVDQEKLELPLGIVQRLHREKQNKKQHANQQILCNMGYCRVFIQLFQQLRQQWCTGPSAWVWTWVEV